MGLAEAFIVGLFILSFGLKSRYSIAFGAEILINLKIDMGLISRLAAHQGFFWMFYR